MMSNPLSQVAETETENDTVSPLTYDEALQATNPADSDEKREKSALALVAGAAANEAYWNSRTELEALKAKAEGHGVIVRGADEEGGSPTIVGTGTDTAAGTIEGTAEEEPPTGIGTGSAAEGTAPADTTPAETPGSSQTLPPTPDNPTEAVAKLRQQLQDAGLTPEA